jgi:hypothetical protein
VERAVRKVNPAPGVREDGRLALAYLYAKCEVLNSPHKDELVSLSQSPHEITEPDFLRELAWVILSAGIAEAVVRSKFADISGSFLEWQSARCISERAEECITNALSHFRHERKIRAIASAAAIVSAAPSFLTFKDQLLRDPIRELQSFAYIGPITVFHIAKNIGIAVAKPDRHLQRLARSSGFESVGEFCGTIASFLGEDIRLVDSVLWRFATMYEDYVARFNQFGSRHRPPNPCRGRSCGIAKGAEADSGEAPALPRRIHRKSARPASP